MADKGKSRGRPKSGRDPGERDVHEALKSLGWVVPESEHDVRQAEEDLAESRIGLPESLTDAAAVFERKAARGFANVSPLCSPLDRQSEQDLARAARQGGPIPPEMEERMRRDRKAAEDAFEQEEPES